MKVEFDGKWFCPGHYVIHPGVREVPVEWERNLPPSAKRVADDAPITPDNQYEPEAPISLREMQRLTAQEGQALRQANVSLKGQITRQKNRVDRLMKLLEEQGIELDEDE